jgi:hypothetical protein
MLKDALIHIEFTESLIRKAVIWLAIKVNKPILKLTEDGNTIFYNFILFYFRLC